MNVCVFSADRRYRYDLWRSVGDSPTSIAFIGSFLPASRRDRFAYSPRSAGGSKEPTLCSILGRFVSSVSDSRFGQRRRRGCFAPTPAGGCTCPP